MFARNAVLALLAILVGVMTGQPAAGAERFTRGQGIYKEGELAYNAGRFAEAVEKMREAIREDPAEGLAKFRHTGLNLEDYLPHYYLGLALERLGDPSGALAALRESRRQGAIAGRLALSRGLDEKIRRLEATTAPSPTPTVPPVLPVVAPTPRLEAPAVSLGGASPVPMATVATSATRPAPATPRVTELAVRGVSTRTPPPAQAAAALAKADLDETREGMRLYYLGRYPEAVRRLEPVAARSPLARLFLAYSLAGRYILEGASNADLLARARGEAASAGSVSFPRDLVSPAVRHILEAPR